ncbi:response regulator [Desulfolutivibrio sulfoxidireducens]|uniref:response regulator n=1 Tax=Desulfolutivibrio sulfoxidireducens TaxID=2773299 RepID=UPI00159DF6B7
MAGAFFHSLRFRLMLLVLLVVAPGLVLTAYMGGQNRHAARIEAFEQARRLALLVAGNGKAMIEGGRHLLFAVARLPELRRHDVAGCSLYFSQIIRDYPGYSDILAVSPDGRVLCGAQGQSTTVDVSDREWFKKTVDRGGFTVGEPVVSRLTGQPVMFLAYPVRNGGGLEAVVAVALHMRWMHELVASLPLPSGTTVSIVDRAGSILSRYPENGGWLDVSIPKAGDILDSLLVKGIDAVEADGLDGVARLYAFAPLISDPGNEYYVRIGIPAAVAYASAEKLMARNVILFGLVAILALVGTFYYGGAFILKPAEVLLRATRRIAGGDLEFRIGPTRDKGEFGELSRSFDDMAGALAEHTRLLRQAEAKYRGLFENAQEGIFRVTLEGRFLDANPALARMLGYDSAEELMAKVTDIGREIYAEPGSRERVLAMLLEKGSVSDFEIRSRRRDGSLGWGSVNSRLVRDESGAVVACEGFATDISERREIAQALRRQHEQLQGILDHSPSFIVLKDRQGRILLANKPYIEAQGFDAAEIFGMDSYAHLVDAAAETTRQEDELVLSTATPHTFFRDIPVRGQWRPFAATKFPLFDASGIPDRVCVVATDISELRAMENELVAAKERAEDASRAKSEFLAKMSHEIRTPMNSIIGLTKITLQSRLDDEQRDYLETVLESSLSLLALINDILDLSKIEAAALALEDVDFSLPRVIGAAIKSMKVQANKKGLHLAAATAKKTPRYVRGDPLRLRQVIINLVGNAIKFTDSGEVLLDVEPLPLAMRHRVTRHDSVPFLFSVRDTGRGIAPDKLDMIFEPFRQADGSVTRRHGGTGLGLAICRQLVELMGGSLWVESVEGRGSVFFFAVCLAPGDPVKAVGERRAVDEARVPGEPLRVLVAEDNAINAKVAEIFLRRLGHTVVRTGTGTEVLEILSREAFDLVLMDLEMPEMDGIAAARAIREGRAGERNRDIPIIAATAHALSGYQTSCLEAGMNAFVAKPLDFKELVALVGQTGSRPAAPDGPGGARVLPGARGAAEARGGKGPDGAEDPANEDGTGLVDVDGVLERLDGDRALYRDLCGIFLEETPVALEKLQRAASLGTLVEVAALAHILKGALGAVGALAVRDQAALLETAAKNGDGEGVAWLLPQTASGVVTVQKEVERFLAGADADARVPEKRPGNGLAPDEQAPLPPAGPRGRRVLIVEDEAINLKLLEKLVRDLGHEAVTARSGEDALTLLPSGVDIVLADVMLPGISGFDLVRRMRGERDYADVPVVMITALSDEADRRAAWECGASDFIVKPVDKSELSLRMTSLLRMKESFDRARFCQAGLEDVVRERTEELRRAVDNLRELGECALVAQQEAILCLSAAAEFKDEQTARHTERIGEYCGLLASLVGLSPDDAELVRQAAPLHDVGKIGIPDSILRKRGTLDPEEWDEMRRHSLYGARILESATSKVMQSARIIALSHHERFDGTGYPYGLAGEGIPIFGRICAVADVFDALVSRRPYKDAYAEEMALSIMRKERGRHFDPAILDVFLANFQAFADIRVRLGE